MTNPEQRQVDGGAPPRESAAVRWMFRLGWALVGAGAVIALFAGSFYLTMHLAFTGREVAVPDLTGLPVEEARAALSRSSLFLEVSSERYDSAVEKGKVLSQDPRPGATIKRDRKVRVIASLGAAEVSIPDVRGQSLRTAQLSLQRETIEVGHVTSVHEGDTLPNVVMAQHPDPGAPAEGMTVQGGSGRIDLLVSRGRPQPVYVMPDLSRHTLVEVNTFAARAGLRVGAVRRERAPGSARGTVVRQYPLAGSPVSRQDIISLVVGE